MRTRKRFGQHFLEGAWADKVVAAIAPQPSDRFVEIGPGPGALTFRLAPRVAHLTAIEVDRDIAAELRPRLPGNVDLVVADVLDVDLLAQAEAPFRVAGNLPYNISTPILFRLIAGRRSGAELSSALQAEGQAPAQPSGRAREPAITGEPAILDATLMVQREVADRLEAVPGTGDYGVLSISVQLHADVRRVLTLPPGRLPAGPQSPLGGRPAHVPSPAGADRRRAAVRGDGPVDVHPAAQDAGERARRLRRRARPARGRRPRAAGVDPSRRPETLTLEELARLAARFATPRSG